MRSPARALPFGTLAGVMTLAIAAMLTWYVCAGLMPWEYLGQSGVPLFDAARLSGSTGLMVFLGIGTLFATLASANGCINDASRAWFAMGRDRYLPGWFGAVHPKYRTPYRSIVFLVPIALAFALGCYRFGRYRKNKAPEVRLVPPDGIDAAEIAKVCLSGCPTDRSASIGTSMLMASVDSRMPRTKKTGR